MEIVFINLDRAVERRRLMEVQAARLGLAFERFAAVEAAAIDKVVADRRGRRWERPLTKPELACFLSHEALWRRVAKGDRPMLILEDDVILSKRLAVVLESLAAFRDADFCNLESFGRRRFSARRALELGPDLAVRRVHRDKSGSAAYVLWPAGARKLLEKAKRGAAPVDAFLHATRQLVSYQAEPAVAMQMHILKARGITMPIASATAIQVPRARPPLTLAQLPFRLRRLRAQVRLLGDRLTMLAGTRIYRETEVVDGEFAQASAFARDDLTMPDGDQRSS